MFVWLRCDNTMSHPIILMKINQINTQLKNNRCSYKYKTVLLHLNLKKNICIFLYFAGICSKGNKEGSDVGMEYLTVTVSNYIFYY